MKWPGFEPKNFGSRDYFLLLFFMDFFFFFCFNLYFYFLATFHCIWDPSSPTRIEPMPAAVEAPNPNHWTTREVPPEMNILFNTILFLWFCSPFNVNLVFSL